jgi:SAM-dependent methyltransferase
MNDLQRYFDNNTGRLIHKWHHYFEIYDRHFARYRGRSPRVLEIGVSQGGSLQMWREYFGPGTRIFGVDINPACRSLAEEGTEIFIGDQADRGFLRRVGAAIGSVDILIDDGGHRMEQLRATFDELFPRVDARGVYLAEDLHTCYWKEFGGGYRKPDSFIEFSKRLIDGLNAWHSRDRRLQVDDFTRGVHSMHYYDSILVVEKRPIGEPRHSKTGSPTVPDWTPAPPARGWRRWLR